MTIKIGNLAISEAVNDRGPKTTHLAVWMSENETESPYIFTRCELEKASKRAIDNTDHVPKLDQSRSLWKRIFG